MDGSSFDKLSVSVHRLREQASRRGAVRLLLGGSLAAAGVGVAAEADAKKKKKKHKNKRYKNKKYKNKKYCRGYGTTCSHSGDCCNGKCRYGFCWYNGGGGGGGGGNCGGQYCPNGWRCRNQGGVHVCVPDNYGNYCGNNSWYGNNYNCCNGYAGGACLTGGDCCGGAGLCCQSGWKCCGGSTCIPQGWNCSDFNLQSAGGVGVESADSIPSMAPTPVDENDYYVSAPVE